MHLRDRVIGAHVVVVLALGTVFGCRSIQLPDQLAAYREREFYTGCNLHFDREEFNDANYHVGALLPVGTRVQIVSIERDTVRFKAEGRTLTAATPRAVP